MRKVEEGQRKWKQRGEKSGNEGVFIGKQLVPVQRRPLSAFELTSGKLNHGSMAD